MTLGRRRSFCSSLEIRETGLVTGACERKGFGTLEFVDMAFDFAVAIEIRDEEMLNNIGIDAQG